MDGEVDTLPRVFVLPGRDKRLQRGHPWAYSNEIKLDPEAKSLSPGTTVTLHRVDGKPLGVASFNPQALITVRLYARDHRTTIDRHFFARRLEAAIRLRGRLYDAPYYRLVHADADGLPGIVIDRYGDAVVCQINTAGAEATLEPLLQAIDEMLTPRLVVLRGDSRSRQQEGLESLLRIAKGSIEGAVTGYEGRLQFFADLQEGQKTGWYFDQRENRAFAARFAGDARVLDLYCYAGGFGLQLALAGAASVVGIDSSQPALDLAAENARLNGLEERCEWRLSNVYEALESIGASGEKFGLVIADPPAFVKSKSAFRAGLRGYRKLARLAAAAIAPAGYLMICSCSHHVGADEFASEIAAGLNGAGRTGRCLRTAGAGPDHPLHPQLTESAYLKSMFFQLD